MKGKKILSAIIAGAMVLGTMSLPAFAEDDVVATITRSDNSTVDYTSYDGTAGVFANVEEGDIVTFHTEKVECARRVFPSVKNVTYTSDYEGGTLMYHGIGNLPAITGSITFKGLKFDGNAIAIYDSTSNAGLDLIIDSCTFNNAGGNCVYIVSEIDSLTVTGCTFTSPDGGAGGQYLVWPYNAHTINITNNTFTGNGTRGAIHLGNATDNATVSGNTINSFERGVQVALSGGGSVNITENTFSDIKKYSDSQGRTAPIFIHNATNQDATTVNVTDNNITNSSAVVFGENSIECISDFTGNTVDSADAGTLENNSATYVAKIGDTKYSTLADAVAAANSLPGDNNITIEITKTGVYDPFTITRNNVTVQGIVGATAEESTVIKNTDTNVINVYNQNITLKNLWIDDSVGHTSYKSAVNVMGSRNPYDNLTVDSCRLVGNGQVGSIAFYYHTTKITITNCTFENFERGYYGCGDNNAMEMLTVTGNTFNNVKVPVDGYWGKVYTGSEEYNIVITDNTFNPDTWGTSYIQLWDYVQYGHYLGWNSCEAGSAIKAKIANNTYNGNTVFYPTHCNVNTVTKIDIAESDEQSLDIIPRYFVALPDEITDADITYSDGSEIDLWNTTKYKVAGSKKLLYTVPTGSFKVTIEKGELKSEEPLTVTAPNEGEILGENIPAITLTDDTFIADEIEVTFVPTADENVYDIVLDGNDKEIYEFVSAEIQFENSSNGYQIDGTNDINVIANTENSDRYGFYLKDGEVSNRITATKIKIGQVTFPAQGTISFKVDADNSKVVATEYNTNLEKYYTAADENAKLTADENGINSTIAAKTRDVLVKVDYAHELVGSWTDNQITVTLKDAFGVTSEAMNISDGEEAFANVPVGRITVTLKAPGFRTFTYTTTVEEGTNPLVLSFWNDTKRGTEKAVEIGGRTMPNNFVVGDIAMDYIVDKYDLAAVTSYYGTYNLTDENKIKYDLNRDGNIDITDVAYVLHNFGF